MPKKISKKKDLVLIHRRFLFRQDLCFQAFINAVAVRFELRRWRGRAERWASRGQGRNTAFYVFLIATFVWLVILAVECVCVCVCDFCGEIISGCELRKILKKWIFLCQISIECKKIIEVQIFFLKCQTTRSPKNQRVNYTTIKEKSNN